MEIEINKNMNSTEIYKAIGNRKNKKIINEEKHGFLETEINKEKEVKNKFF